MYFHRMFLTARMIRILSWVGMLLFLSSSAFLFSQEIDKPKKVEPPETEFVSVEEIQLVGVWALIEARNFQTGKSHQINGKMVYEFRKHGALVITNLEYRERSFWNWELENKTLLMIERGLGGNSVRADLELRNKDSIVLFPRKRKLSWLLERI